MSIIVKTINPKNSLARSYTSTRAGKFCSTLCRHRPCSTRGIPVKTPPAEREDVIGLFFRQSRHLPQLKNRCGENFLSVIPWLERSYRRSGPEQISAALVNGNDWSTDFFGLEKWQTRAGLGHPPQTILDTLAGIQSADVRLSTDSGQTLPQPMNLPRGLEMWRKL